MIDFDEQTEEEYQRAILDLEEEVIDAIVAGNGDMRGVRPAVRHVPSDDLEAIMGSLEALLTTIRHEVAERRATVAQHAEDTAAATGQEGR